jgi:mxaD protein
MPTPEINIAAAPDAVWEVAGDFGGLAAWMPGVESCEVEGDVRTIGMMGMSVQEQLTGLDAGTRSLTYSVMPGGAVPIESHSATITVHPDGAGSRVTWEVTVSPDGLQGMFEDIYQQSLGALKTRCEQ